MRPSVIPGAPGGRALPTNLCFYTFGRETILLAETL
jgi:hypothetical protein